jgi:hypothetical protein
MSKASRNKKVKNVSGVPVSSHDQEVEKIRQIGFPRAWLEARERDPSLPEAPPEGIPEEAKKVITHLVRRVLQLELEWS